jgi:tetratricopeptide (TPR) repeat protein
MKKLFILILSVLPLSFLQAQLSGNLFGTDYSFDKPTFGGRGGNNNWSSKDNSSTGSSPSIPHISGVNMGKIYKDFAREAYKKGNEYWNKDWTKAIRHYKKAKDYDPAYTNVYNDAIGYNEWDKAGKDFDKKEWDRASSHYIEALKYFPNNKDLKNNIIASSYNKVSGLAKKYYDEKNWVYAAAYYNVLMKNFDERGQVETLFSQCYTEVGKMKRAENAYSKFNAKVKEIKDDLPFVNNTWQPAN